MAGYVEGERQVKNSIKNGLVIALGVAACIVASGNSNDRVATKSMTRETPAAQEIAPKLSKMLLPPNLKLFIHFTPTRSA